MKRLYFFLILSLFLIGIASASFEVGNESHDINKQYSLGGMIRGWINISLNSEPISSLLKSNFGDSINLMELFKLNTIPLDCIPTNCETDYSAVAGSSRASETFTLNNGESKRFGFNLSGKSQGDFVEVTSFRINVTSNAPESTKSQLSIELVNLDDNKVEWRAYVASGDFYNERDGCYDSNPEGQAEIVSTKYCETISIPASTKVEIGAYVTENPNYETQPVGSADLLFIIEESGTKIDDCSTTINGPGRVSCIVDLNSDKLKDLSVCVQASSGDKRKYQIDYETKDPCGFSGDFGDYSIDFDIFAKAGKYNKTGSFILNNDELQNSNSFVDDIELYIDNYVSQRYDNNCLKGCVIPIEFISGIDNQQIEISDFALSYTATTAETLTNFYNITETSAVINSDFQKFELDKANFSIPSTFGNHTFSLKLGGENIFSEKILIEKIPQIISLSPDPHIVAAANPTEFTVGVEKFDANTSIIKYEWNFGNGDKQTTVVNKTTYTYPSIGNFKLNVTIIDSNKAKSTKSFDITVKTPKDAVNDILDKNKENFEKIDSQIKKMPLFYQNSLKDALSLNETGLILSDLQKRNANPSNTAKDYIDMMIELVKLKIPRSINITERADSFLSYTSKNKINLNILSEISGNEYSINKSDLYYDEILRWNLNNVEMKIDYKEFSGVYEDSIVEILNIFEININENQARNNSLFVIPKLENLKFGSDYSEEEKSGYYYFEINDDETNIDFSTTEKIDLFELPIFISPRISYFSYIELGKEEREKLSKQTILTLSLLLIVFLGFLSYLILQEWYKRKYESYLFKNKNELYNLVSYIESANKRNLSGAEIASKLRKIGWSSEQVKYIMRKYSGKRTGMLELIPLGKILSIFSKKSMPLNRNRVRNPKFNSTRKFNKAL